MPELKVNFTKLNNKAHTPEKAYPGDAGFDLTATSKRLSEDEKYIEYGTGISVEIPEGYVGLLCARSSISELDLVLANSVGIIDSSYRGELKFRFKKLNSFLSEESIYSVGDKLGQLVIISNPSIELIELNTLDPSLRGLKSFGSSSRSTKGIF